MDAEDLLREMSAAVSAEPAKEITGLQILSYIHSNNLVELSQPQHCFVADGDGNCDCRNWIEEFLTAKAYLNTSKDNHAPGVSVSS